MIELAAWIAEAQRTPAVEAPASDRSAPPPASKPAAPANEVEGVVVTAPLAAPEPEWARKFNFDTRGAYAPSGTPYLRQRPTNGCKSMAGGSVSPTGRHGVAGGMVCAKPF